MKIGFAPKTVEVGDGTYLHFWYANNLLKARTFGDWRES
jgi:hypothetical protein